MKKILSIACIIAAAVTFSSCKDFLDVKPSNQGDSSTSISSASDAEVMINGLMSKMSSSSYYGRDNRYTERCRYSHRRGIEVIVDERLVTYINSLDTGNTEILDEIEREALETYVPIVRKEMQSFLKLILSIKRPARILEVGTAVGFSAILMAEYNPIPCEITTIENYEKRIPIAKNVRK